jgi:uncharacterized membrane protein YjjB (DUF3815 family)
LHADSPTVHAPPDVGFTQLPAVSVMASGWLAASAVESCDAIESPVALESTELSLAIESAALSAGVVAVELHALVTIEARANKAIRIVMRASIARHVPAR